MTSDRGTTRRELLGTTAVGVGVLLGLPQFSARQRLLAATDRIANQFGWYTAYRLSSQEYIGVTQGAPASLLDDTEYEPQPIAAVKYHPDTGDIDDGSWRLVDPEHPRWQWHVHLWEVGSSRTEIYSHYEFRPDPYPIAGESIATMRQRLHDHYHPKWDDRHPPDEATYFLGNASDSLLEALRRS